MESQNLIVGGIVTILLIVAVVAGFMSGGQNENGTTNEEEITNNNTNNMSEEMPTNEENPIVTLKTTLGEIKIELFVDKMPVTAGNFLKLAGDGFYTNQKFHRVIPGFMIQGGDPLTKDDTQQDRWGTGGPGYAIEDEHVEGEGLSNTRGTISMANSGPNSGGSQFFINVANNTNLDFDKEPLSSKHPVFGKVITGMDVADAISTTPTGPRDVPDEAVEILEVTVENI